MFVIYIHGRWDGWVLLDLFPITKINTTSSSAFLGGRISMTMLKFKIKANNCVGISAKLINEKLQGVHVVLEIEFIIKNMIVFFFCFLRIKIENLYNL